MQAQDCKDPVDGDKCHKFVTWALAKGPKALPDLFSNFICGHMRTFPAKKHVLKNFPSSESGVVFY